MARENKKRGGDDSRMFAFLAAFLSIIGFIIVLIAKRSDKYAMFYAKQTLVVFITALIAWIARGIVSWIPILGGAIKAVLSIIVVILWVISWVYALSGNMKEVPFVGSYARKIKI